MHGESAVDKTKKEMGTARAKWGPRAHSHVVVLLLLLLTACGGGQSTNTEEQTNASAGDGDEVSADSANEGEPDGTTDAADLEPVDGSLTVALVSNPPVFPASFDLIVADEEGLFDKYGVDVTLRPFETGVEATRAVSTGETEVAVSPTSVFVTSIAQGAALTGILGLTPPTWLVATTSPEVQACEDLEGETIAVDAIGGIRYIVLDQMLADCGVSIGDIDTVTIHVAPVIEALVAGQLDNSVLHLYEYANVQTQLTAEGNDREIRELSRITDVNPNVHFVVLAASEQTMNSQRDALVRLVAANLEAREMIRDRANHDRLSQYGPITGIDPDVAKLSIELYMELEGEFWAYEDAIMDRESIEDTINNEAAAGNIEEGEEPAYEDITTLDIYEEAFELYQQHRG